jgi:hypothetical protein
LSLLLTLLSPLPLLLFCSVEQKNKLPPVNRSLQRLSPSAACFLIQTLVRVRSAMSRPTSPATLAQCVSAAADYVVLQLPQAAALLPTAVGIARTSKVLARVPTEATAALESLYNAMLDELARMQLNEKGAAARSSGMQVSVARSLLARRIALRAVSPRLVLALPPTPPLLQHRRCCQSPCLRISLHRCIILSQSCRSPFVLKPVRC